MAKKAKRNYSAKVELKVTASQLRGPVDKAKVRSRGPGHIGQLKHSHTVHLGNIEQGELTKRLKFAQALLETGKGPKAESGKEKIQALEAELGAAKRTIKELTDAAEKTPEPVVEKKAPAKKAPAKKK